MLPPVLLLRVQVRPEYLLPPLHIAHSSIASSGRVNLAMTQTPRPYLDYCNQKIRVYFVLSLLTFQVTATTAHAARSHMHHEAAAADMRHDMETEGIHSRAPVVRCKKDAALFDKRNDAALQWMGHGLNTAG